MNLYVPWTSGCDELGTSEMYKMKIITQIMGLVLGCGSDDSWNVRNSKYRLVNSFRVTQDTVPLIVRECPPWCSIVGATGTVHQYFYILHCSLSAWITPQTKEIHRY